MNDVWVCCGVIRAEMEELCRRGLIGGRLLFLDSMLHMNPQRLEEALVAELATLASPANRIVLVYGDCSASMLDLVRRFGVSRTPIINCGQLLVGRARYRELMREGAFLVLPEWAPRWKQIMRTELGLERTTARDLMRENRSVLVYLDTGLVPVPVECLEDFSAYTGLPLRIETVSLDVMCAALLAARSELDGLIPG
ncbi:DUF1638 domain-containing protein [Geomonas sp. Red32]|uniref:DUF1638 domain-containing protein n=1 Tax=Geomonas sp. Red32 TaxID=2912856 RepID=UPI00202CB8C0|nr:DUF1638 domain-containing protein [Geomonas sp. Red32]MCM0083809.1 DUF1638 domain-containing protein [Geomonas sp. Red32]